MMCCYCCQSIEQSDATAINLNITSLWHKRNPAVQHLVAHSACFAKHLDPQVPFLDEVWGPEDRD